ncbi:BadF/BadG/BcrA/BcrD ATPase family protein [Marinobacterium sedimentorum]|uniref:BadF/BadG/BcrA/BcrD ATPase family protein n=1 Tax=Marinobacterium sedimentorum TaxID=2927804 RepID=UPI0020C5EDE4|nr:BadF/BadG/BcrA/BcrD ATPase family protein [Marinobacterium sedimentorum]MCP8690175.1 N-acetylglucosamine kinase [Marinobacterium sedimentorum]
MAKSMNDNAVYLLGADGGGTSCRVRLSAIDGQVLGEGRSGSANVRLGVDNAYAEILKATDEALNQAGLDRSVLAHTYAGFGLAGAVDEARRASVRQFPHPFAGVAIETDAHTACLGAHGGEPGGILILGTGSCGVYQNAGRFDVIGGWGFMISDQGSGAWLGLNLVRQAMLALDGVIEQTPLSQAVLARFDNSHSQVLDWSEQARPRDYGAFAPQVLQYAAAQDPLALRLLQQCGGDAGDLLARLQRLGARRVCLMGGLSEPLRPWLPAALLPLLCAPVGDAMDGALLLARGLLNVRGS